jgi:hypothetical protein
MRLLVALLISSSLFSQVGTGEWRLHVPAKKSIDVVVGNNMIYAAFLNGVLEYDLSNSEKSLWTNVNGLSDINISCLAYSQQDNSLFIGYTNGNIDKIKDNRVTNIPAIKLAQIQGSKKINRIVIHENHAYFATDFSVVKVDIEKNEVRDTYYPGNGTKPILDLAFRNDSIFALSPDRMYRGFLNNPALADPSYWITDHRLPTLTVPGYKDLEKVNGELVVLHQDPENVNDSVFRIKNTGLEWVNDAGFNMEVVSLNTINGKLAVNMYGGVLVYNENNSYAAIINLYSFGGEFLPNQSVGYNNKFYIADDVSGLVEYTSTSQSQKISFSGPPKNEFYALDWNKGKLAVAGGKLSGNTVVFSTAGVYTFKDEVWHLTDPFTAAKWQSVKIWDCLSVSVDPVNGEKTAVGSYSEVPLSILDASDDVSEIYTLVNSPIEETSLNNGWALVSATQYDEQGNLWIVNGYSQNPLKVLSKDNVWYSYDTGNASKNKFTKKIAIDYNGNKWFAVEGQGLFAYTDNGTLGNINDDAYRQLSSDPMGGNLPSNSVSAIAVDFDNEIWIGTDNGFAILYNSENVFTANPGDFNAQRIKLEYEGNVEYLLGNTFISDIEVDGANRKWVATANAGILLLSADGSEIIEQWTVDNSPLISNNIIDIELDQTSGELFIVTDIGLVSYRTDASYEDPEYASVKVFPNPVNPDFYGPITIQGIRYNSDVKITDIAGNLVYKTTSNGGTATWNGKTLTGERVKTGVYLIWTAANEEKGKKVGKVVVIN